MGSEARWAPRTPTRPRAAARRETPSATADRRGTLPRRWRRFGLHPRHPRRGRGASPARSAQTRPTVLAEFGLIFDAVAGGGHDLEPTFADLLPARLAASVRPLLQAPKRGLDLGQLQLRVLHQ